MRRLFLTTAASFSLLGAVSGCAAAPAARMEQERALLLLSASDRARQVADQQGAVAGFDALATYLSSKEGHCSVGWDGRKGARERLDSLYPNVRGEIDRAFASGLIGRPFIERVYQFHERRSTNDDQP